MAVGIVHRLKAVEIQIKQGKRLPAPFQRTDHCVEIPLVQQAGEGIGVGQLLQQMLPAHILCDYHHAGEPSFLPAAGHHRHHQESALVAGSVLELEGVLRRFELSAEVFRREHPGELCVLAVGQRNILAGDLLPQLPEGTFRRVKIFFLPLMVLIAIGVEVADGEAVYKTGHSFEHLVSNFLAALQLLLFGFCPLTAHFCLIVKDLAHAEQNDRKQCQQQQNRVGLHGVHAAFHSTGRYDTDDGPVLHTNRLIHQIIPR